MAQDALSLIDAGTAVSPDEALNKAAGSSLAGQSSFIDMALGAQAAFSTGGFQGAKLGFQALGKGETWRDLLSFRWRDMIERETGVTRMQETKVLVDADKDARMKQAEMQQRRRNMAAGLALMQNSGLIQFFR